MKKIIYHKNYRFGVMENDDDTVVDCHFHNEFSKRRIVKSALVEVDESYFDHTKNIVDNNDYYYKTISKGTDYFNREKVCDVEYNHEYISATVIGNSAYKVTIRKNKKSFSDTCTCPVGSRCKHIYATCLALNKIHDDLLLNDLNCELIDGLKNNTNKFISDGKDSYDGLLSIIDILSKEDNTQLSKYLNYINYNVSYQRNVYDIIRAICFNIKIRKKLIEVISNYHKIPFINDLYSYLNTASTLDDTYKYSRNKYRYQYMFANKKFSELLYCIFLDGYEVNNEFYKCILINSDIDETVYEAYKDYITNRESLYGYDHYLFIKLDDNHKKDLLSFDYFRNLLPYSDYKDYDLKLKRQYLLRVSNFDIDTYIESIECEYKLTKDKKYAAELFMNLRQHYEPGYEVEDNSVLKIINNKYFTNYVCYKRPYSYYYTNRNFIYDTKHVGEVDEKEFCEYFKFDISVRIDETDDEPRFIIEYALRDLLDNDILLIEKNDKYLKILDSSINDEDNIIGNYLVYYCDNKYHDFIENRKEEYLEKIRKEKEEKRLNAAIQSMKYINDSLSTDLIFNDNHKANLEYYINTNEDIDDYKLYKDDRYTISLKVGVKKYYIVKNIVEFLSKFKNKEKFNYGKELTLTHDVNNFNDVDKEIINMMLASNIESSYKHYQYGKINGSFVNNLLKVLKGKRVYIDNLPYTVKLEEKEIEVEIDDEYTFKVKNLDNSIKAFSVLDEIYLLDKKNLCVDVLKMDKDEINFYNFAFVYNGICLKEINDEFKKNIYSNYFSNIQVTDKLKEEYKVENLLIDSYFDYHDKQISLKNEYLIGDKKVDINSITNNLDLARLTNYQNLIKSIGINEGLMEDDEDILNFFNMDFSNLKRYGNVYLSESIQNKQLIKFSPGKIVVRQNSNIMEAFLKESKYSDDELYEIMKSIKHKKKYVLLSDDKIIDLSDNEVFEFENTIKDLGLNTKKLLEPAPLPIINSFKALAHEKYCDIDDYLTEMIHDISHFKDAEYMIPKIDATLRNYQVEGYKWLKVLTEYKVGGILADDMGLGKTIQIITLITSDKNLKPSLIVCPKSLVFNWKNEFTKFSKEIEVVEVYGNKEYRDNLIKNIDVKKKRVYITSYESLLRDIDNYKTPFNFMIIDEAQSIKNINAQKTKSIKKIKAVHKFALTGTPIENNILDLYSIFDFVLPGYFNDVNEFKNNNDNDEFINKLSKSIAPFVLRRTKDNVLKELPEKFERVIACEMSTKQRKVYDAHKKMAKDVMDRTGKAFDILPYIMKLRQICVDPNLIIDDYNGESAKTDKLIEMIKEYTLQDHKILVFSQFVKALDLISNQLDKENIPYYVITGDTSAKRRLEIADEFNNNSKEKICLISLKAGGTGLNLIGADTVIHLDPWWNVAAENQASDRTHRIGQTKNVEVIKMILEDSIEQRVIELQNIKKNLIDKVISDSDETVTSASLEDIRFILD